LRETLEIATLFIDSRKPKILVPANDVIIPNRTVSILQPA
jgi:hypothetical protein